MANVTIEIISTEQNGKSLEETNTEQNTKNKLGSTKQDVPREYLDSNSAEALKNLSKKALKTVKEIGLNGIQFGLNRAFNLKEDYLSENGYNNTKKLITTVFGTTMQAGAKFASGDIIGGIVSLANPFVEEAKKMNHYYKTLNETNMQTSFQGSRMGLINGSHGTEN